MEQIFYKTHDDVELHIDMYYPENDKINAMIVLFFGGGWLNGSTLQFYRYAEELTHYGIIVALPHYRTFEGNQTLVDTAIHDAIYSLEHLTKIASEKGVEKGNVLIGGGSAGGHLALSTVLLKKFIPVDFEYIEYINKFILFNPVVDAVEFENRSNLLSVTPYSTYDLSPFHNVKEGNYSAIIFHGKADHVVPIETARKFKDEMEAFGNRCKLVEYEGKSHGFFNCRENSIAEFYSVLGKVIEYLCNEKIIELELMWR